MIEQNQAVSTLRLARVTRVYPEGQSMDVIFLDTGDFGRNVQVMSPMAGTDFGFTSGIPSPEEEGHEANLTDDPGKRTITCVVASAGGVNICLGFLYPQVTEMAFDKEHHKNRSITRYPSDVYTTVDDQGNAFICHPSAGGGVFAGMGVAAGSAPALAGNDFDERFKLKHNVDQRPIVKISCKYGDSPMPPGGSATCDGGAWTVEHLNNIALSTTIGDISARSGRHVSIVADANYTCEVDEAYTDEVKGATTRLSRGVHTLQSDTMVHIQAPIIYLDGGVVFGGPASGALDGNGVIVLNADIAHTGNMTTSGEHIDKNDKHISASAVEGIVNAIVGE